MKKIDRYSPCPCDSGKPYHKCCSLYHQGQAAPTPLALMRSRYSAYALGLVDYVMATTDAENSAFMSDTAAWGADLLQFCQHTNFDRLKIVEAETESEAEREKDIGAVTFIAYLRQGGADASFSEKSLFRRGKDGRWLYFSGETAKVQT